MDVHRRVRSSGLGSAIGLGNIWRFSYVVGENGGGAFIVVYLVAVLALGLQLLIAELAIGKEHAARRRWFAEADHVARWTRRAP